MPTTIQNYSKKAWRSLIAFSILLGISTSLFAQKVQPPLHKIVDLEAKIDATPRIGSSGYGLKYTHKNNRFGIGFSLNSLTNKKGYLITYDRIILAKKHFEAFTNLTAVQTQYAEYNSRYPISRNSYKYTFSTYYGMRIGYGLTYYPVNWLFIRSTAGFGYFHISSNTIYRNHGWVTSIDLAIGFRIQLPERYTAPAASED